MKTWLKTWLCTHILLFSVGKLKQKRTATTGNSKETEDLTKNESSIKDISTKAPGIPPKKPIVIPKASTIFEKPKVHRAQKAKSEGNIVASSSKVSI